MVHTQLGGITAAGASGGGIVARRAVALRERGDDGRERRIDPTVPSDEPITQTSELSASFREALARWASGVTVVTVRDPDAAPEGEGGGDGASDAASMHGLTASSFTSVSLDPPLVLVCVSLQSHTLPVLQKAERFTVSLLSEAQAVTSDHFANRPGVNAPPAFDALGGIAGSVAVLACDLWQDYPGGDHRILVGRVTKIELAAQAHAGPLLYWQRRYRGLRSDG